MDSRQFDDLTKALATSTSRRKALQRIGGTLAGSMLAAWPFSQALAAGGGNSQCAHFCATVFGADTPAANQCTSEAAHGKGLCYQCGPAATAGHPPLCGQVCCQSGQVCDSTSTCASPTYEYFCRCNLGNGAFEAVITCLSGTCPDDLTAVCTQVCAGTEGYVGGTGSCGAPTNCG